MDRDALAGFLRTHRAKLDPEDVGLSPGVRRRTPGLRREEVAALANMSTDYYTRLEQRRGPRPSEQMLTALARALRLTIGERDYLFQVAGRSAKSANPETSHVAPPLLRALDRLQNTPALIVSSLAEVLAVNHMAKVLLGDPVRHTGWARSQIYRWFTDPAERSRYLGEDRDRQGRALVAMLRATLGMQGPTSRAAELAALLHDTSEEFGQLWDHFEVAKRFVDHKTLIHPELGSIEVDCQALFTEDQSQALLVFTAEPHSEDHDKLQLLNVLAVENR